MISKNDAFDKSRFSRIKKIRPLEDAEANSASPEDVIIKKMEYSKEGESEKHLRDIIGMLKVKDIWQSIQERLSK